MVVFGLDFGTTFSSVCVLKSNEVFCFKQQNSAYIPTTLYFYANSSELTFGYDADILASDASIKGGMFKDLKRWVGCDEGNYDDYLRKLKPHYGVRLISVGAGSRKTVSLETFKGTGKYECNLPVLISLYVRSLISAAESAFTVSCTGIIVSVPANYNCLQRSFTESCVSLSGYTCVYMINEPSAAALSVCTKLPRDSSDLLVYDFGGGTFDVSALSVMNNTYVVRSSGGDLNLGGRDVDKAFSMRLFEIAGLPYDASFDVSSLKEVLSSSSDSVKYTITSQDGRSKQILVKPSLLNEVMAPFIKRTVVILKDVFTTYKTNMALSTTRKAKLLLVGGSSYLPGLKSMLSAVDDVETCVEVDDARIAVAAGCALYSSCLTESSAMLLVDCASHNLGIPDVLCETIVLVPAGSPIPFTGKRSITLMNSNMTSVYSPSVFEGDYTKCARNKKIFQAEIKLSDYGVSHRDFRDIPMTIHVKVSSVGTVKVFMEGPDGVMRSAEGAATYDFKTVRLPSRSVVELHKYNANRVLVILSLNRKVQQRSLLSEVDKNKLSTDKQVGDADAYLTNFKSKDDASTSYCKLLLGKSVQKVLRGSRVDRVLI